MRTPDRRSFDPALVYGALTVIAALLGVAATYFATAYLGRGGLYEILLFTPADSFGPLADGPGTSFGVHHFGDLLLPWLQTAEGNPYQSTTMFRSNYPPFAHLLLLPTTLLPYKMVFYLYLVASLALLVVPTWASLRGRRIDARLIVVASVVGLCFPLWVTLDRGNIQAIVVGLAMLGALAIARGRWTTAAVLLALPVALKGYPIFLLVLLVRERRWRDLAVSTSLVIALSISGVATMAASPMANIRAMWFQTAGFRVAAFDPSFVSRYNISPLSFFQWIQLRSDLFGARLGASLIYHFELVALVALLGCVILALSRRLTRFEASTIALLPTLFVLQLVSAYALLLMMVPLVFLFSAGRDVSRLEVLMMGLIVVLLAPKTVPIDATGATLANIAYPVLEALIFFVGVAAFTHRYVGDSAVQRARSALRRSHLRRTLG